jgi:hypothetical protein
VSRYGAKDVEAYRALKLAQWASLRPKYDWKLADFRERSPVRVPFEKS